MDEIITLAVLAFLIFTAFGDEIAAIIGRWIKIIKEKSQ